MVVWMLRCPIQSMTWGNWMPLEDKPGGACVSQHVRYELIVLQQAHVPPETVPVITESVSGEQRERLLQVGEFAHGFPGFLSRSNQGHQASPCSS